MKIYRRAITFADSKGDLFSIVEKISKTDFFKAYESFNKSADFTVYKLIEITGFAIQLENFRLEYFTYEI